MPLKRPYPAFNLRMHPELRITLATEAAKNQRSLNAEIVHRLQASLRTQYRA